MKHALLIILVVVLLPNSLFGMENRNDSLLNELDKVISNRPHFLVIKETKISDLKQKNRTSLGRRRSLILTGRSSINTIVSYAILPNIISRRTWPLHGNWTIRRSSLNRCYISPMYILCQDFSCRRRKSSIRLIIPNFRTIIKHGIAGTTSAISKISLSISMIRDILIPMQLRKKNGETG